MKQLNQEDRLTCELVLHPAPVPGSWMINRHLELVCEDCDAKRLTQGVTLGQVQEWLRTGRITQPAYEAYCFIWTVSAPRFSSLGAGLPAFEDARRIARKIWTLKFSPRPMPAGLVDPGV
jgi:hypothetical protein